MLLPIREVRVTDAGDHIVVQVKRKFRRSVKWSRPAVISKGPDKASRSFEIEAFLVDQGLVTEKPGRPPVPGSKRMPGGEA